MRRASDKAGDVYRAVENVDRIEIVVNTRDEKQTSRWIRCYGLITTIILEAEGDLLEINRIRPMARIFRVDLVSVEPGLSNGSLLACLPIICATEPHYWIGRNIRNNAAEVTGGEWVEVHVMDVLRVHRVILWWRSIAVRGTVFEMGYVG